MWASFSDLGWCLIYLGWQILLLTRIVGNAYLLLWQGPIFGWMWHLHWKRNDSSWRPCSQAPNGKPVYVLFADRKIWSTMEIIVPYWPICNIQLKFGKNEDFQPCNGRWNFNNKVIVCKDFRASLFPFYFYPLFLALQMLLEPRAIKSWAIVNFSFPCDSSHISRELISCGMRKGIVGFVDTVSIFLYGL